MSITNIFQKTLSEIIIHYRGDIDEPLDGDAVEELVNVLRHEINIHEGNVTEFEV
jgi:hypothetical protein